MNLLEQALKAKAEGRLEEWFLALPPERKKALKFQLELENLRTMTTIIVNAVQVEHGPSETK